jgi:hypothetical protein
MSLALAHSPTHQVSSLIQLLEFSIALIRIQQYVSKSRVNATIGGALHKLWLSVL